MVAGQAQNATSDGKRASADPEVFISYHRGTPAASALANTLYNQLAGRGLRPFLDERNVGDGDEWARKIYTSLFSCGAAVIVISRAGMVASEWLYHESAIPMSRYDRWGDLVIIPVLLDETLKPKVAGAIRLSQGGGELRSRACTFAHLLFEEQEHRTAVDCPDNQAQPRKPGGMACGVRHSPGSVSHYTGCAP